MQKMANEALQITASWPYTKNQLYFIGTVTRRVQVRNMTFRIFSIFIIAVSGLMRLFNCLPCQCFTKIPRPGCIVTFNQQICKWLLLCDSTLHWKMSKIFLQQPLVFPQDYV